MSAPTSFLVMRPRTVGGEAVVYVVKGAHPDGRVLFGFTWDIEDATRFTREEAEELVSKRDAHRIVEVET